MQRRGFPIHQLVAVFGRRLPKAFVVRRQFVMLRVPRLPNASDVIVTQPMRRIDTQQMQRW